MNLYLIRHAEAIDHETDSVKTDEYRFLTSKGRKLTRKVVSELKNELFSLDIIFTSPLIRAVQTAEIIATCLKYKNDVEVANELRIGSSTSKVLQLLKRNSQYNSVALVGHEPMMSMLVEAFSNVKKFTMNFRKSAVCMIEMDLNKDLGKFKWFFNPKEMTFSMQDSKNFY